MDSLANYGSDDDCEENRSEKTGMPKAGEGSRTLEADANYDEVQMDLSEESNNNNSAEEEDYRRERSVERKRVYRSRSRDSSVTKISDVKLNRHDDELAEHDNFRKYDDRNKKYDYKPRHDAPHNLDRMYDRPSYSSTKYRDSRSRTDDRSRKYRRSSRSRERKRSSSRERRRSSSTDRKRCGSRERGRSRSPRSDYRRRSRSQEKERGGSSRYGKRFDRTSNKMAQLEKLGIEIKTPDAEFVTPQMLLQRSMDEQVQKIKNSTGIELPKYYNPAAMNPARYADQIQKRRMLWQKKNSEKQSEPGNMGKVWEQTTFAQDADGKVASKFKRLMGIKDDKASALKQSGKDILKKQEEMFSSMEQQYEVARTATHTMRGVGLGFGTYNNYPR